MQTINIILEIGGLEVFLFLLGVLLLIGVIYAIREAVCWYWKINDTVSELKKINENLTKIIEGQKIKEL